MPAFSSSSSGAGGLDDGLQHYRVLQLPRSASQAQIKQAYRRLAKTLHPDKGGTSQGFAALQAAFETLINPKTRAVYDALAADVRFRPGAAAPYKAANAPQDPSQAPPPTPGVTEAALLQQLLRRCHAGCTDPATQLCVTCEVCRRPATKECWTCSMPICDFCTRRQHWKGAVALHWPLVNAPNRLVEQLGRQELEQKRKEDAQAYKMRQPGYRPQSELLLLRSFQDAVISSLAAAAAAAPVAPAPVAALVAAPVAAPAASAMRYTTGPTPSNPATAAGDSPWSARVESTKSSSAVAPSTNIRTGTRGKSMFAIAAAAATISKPPNTCNQQVPAGSLNKSEMVLLPAQNPTTAAAAAAGALTATSTGNSIVSSRGGSCSSMNRCLKAWEAAAPETLRRLLTCYDVQLSRFYMWAQTEGFILMALHLPTGGTATPPKLNIQATSTTLLVQHQGFAPVLSRSWSKQVDLTAPLTSWVSGDGQMLGLLVPKATPGELWTACFKGDSYGARCLSSPYSLLQLAHEVQLEVMLPFWVHPVEDVEVVLGQQSLSISVDGLFQMKRHYWRDAVLAGRLGDSYKVVDVPASSWAVVDDQQQCGFNQQSVFLPCQDARAAAAAGNAGAANVAVGATRHGRAGKLLCISLALPAPTEEECLYKKGVRQNNAAAVRNCSNGAGKKGFAFFSDDEDEFGLTALLQALQFHAAGYAWVAAKPWEAAAGTITASSPAAAAAAAAAVVMPLVRDKEALQQSLPGSVIVPAGPDPSTTTARLLPAGGCAGGGGSAGGRWVAEERYLPDDVQQHLKWLRQQQGRESTTSISS